MSDLAHFYFTAGLSHDEPVEHATFEISDYSNAEVLRPGQHLRVLVEQVISIHILEMRSTSAVQSARALRELEPSFDFYVSTGKTLLLTGANEPQTVLLEGLTARPRPMFVPLSRSMTESPEASRLRLFFAPIVERLASLPEAEWRMAAIQAMSAPADDESPWAAAIGPLYSLEGMSAALNLPVEVVRKTVDAGALLSLVTSDGAELFPAEQLRPDGHVVRGLPWILSRLTEDLVDRYTLAAWLHSPKGRLGGRSIWDLLLTAEALPEEVTSLVNQFTTAASE